MSEFDKYHASLLTGFPSSGGGDGCLIASLMLFVLACLGLLLCVAPDHTPPVKGEVRNGPASGQQMQWTGERWEVIGVPALQR